MGKGYSNPVSGVGVFIAWRGLGHGGVGHEARNTPTPETGLEYLFPVTQPTMLWQVMLTSTP